MEAKAGNTAASMGPDHFLAVLENTVEGIIVIDERGTIQTANPARERYMLRLGEEIRRQCDGVTLSVGIARTGPDDYVDPDRLIRLADEKMYAEKRKKKQSAA